MIISDNAIKIIILSVIDDIVEARSSLSQYRLLLHLLINAFNVAMSAAEQYPRYAGEQNAILARAVDLKTSWSETVFNPCECRVR